MGEDPVPPGVLVGQTGPMRRALVVLGLVVLLALVGHFGGGMLWTAIPGNAPHSLSTDAPGSLSP